MQLDRHLCGDGVPHLGEKQRQAILGSQRSYLCKDYSGRWYLASSNLTAALDREELHGPLNLPLALSIEVGQVWRSASTSNRWRVISLTLPVEDGGPGVGGPDGRIGVELIRHSDKHHGATYQWAPGSFEDMRNVGIACPACGRPHDPTYIPPPRVPPGSRCACCCQ